MEVSKIKQIKKQKIAFVLVLLIVSALCMTACGNPSDEDSQEAVKPCPRQ